LSHAHIVRQLLEKQASVDLINNDGLTALMFAAAMGHKDVVQRLLEKQASVDLINNDGLTALMFAAQNGHTDIVRQLLEKQASVDLKHNDGLTALMFAAQNGHTDIVRQLLEKQASVDLKHKDGFTALMLAAENGRIDVVQLLLKHGAAINLTNTDEATALHFASENGHKDVVQLLLKHGADIDLLNMDGKNALMLAIEKNYVKEYEEVVQLLMKKQLYTELANIQKQLSESDTDLERKVNELNNLLDKIFICDELYPKEDGKGDVFVKILNKAKDNPQMVEYLCDYFNKKNISFQDKFDKKGFNILHHAAYKFTPEACEKLLQNIHKAQIKTLLQHETQLEHPIKKDKKREITPYAFAVARAAGVVTKAAEGGSPAARATEGDSPEKKIKAIFEESIKNNCGKDYENPCKRKWKVHVKASSTAITNESAAAGVAH